ncbi:MAG: hypothetical protein V7695_13625 [Sulfitobacter sp.]
MTEYLKQIAEAWGDRIRSPILGSILIFFTLTNWQALFYLFFADKPVRARLYYFDANTDNWSLYGIPLIAGILSAIAVPWITLLGAFIAKMPRAFLHKVQFLEASKRRIIEYHQRAQEETAIAQLEASKEHRQIEAAKRLEEASAVSDDLKEDLEAERQVANERIENKLDPHELRQLTVISFAAKSGRGKVIVDVRSRPFKIVSPNDEVLVSMDVSHKEYTELLDGLEKAASNGFLKGTSDGGGQKVYDITSKGYEFLDRFAKSEPVKQHDPTDHIHQLPRPRQ